MSNYFKTTDKGKKYFKNSRTEAIITTVDRAPISKKDDSEYRKSTNRVITKRYVVK